MDPNQTKMCTGCMALHALNNFNRDARGKYGVDSRCRACKRVRMAQWRGTKTSRPTAYKEAQARRAAGLEIGKICSKCSEYKLYAAYDLHAGGAAGRHPRCKDCRSKEQRTHYIEHREAVLTRVKRRYVQNRRTILTQLQQKNAQPHIALMNRLKATFHQILRRKRIAVSERGSFARLPYNPLQLLHHLSRYLDCPCIGGCGRYLTLKTSHVDHITPLALAKTEQDVIQLNALTNLRLLCPTCNMRKSARLEAA